MMQEISYATLADIPDWMNFITLVIDGFPCLDESSHLEQVKRYIHQRQALIMRDGSTIIGAAAFFLSDREHRLFWQCIRNTGIMESQRRFLTL